MSQACSAVARKTKTVAFILFIVLLLVYGGVTEFALWFFLTPWIRYVEFWLKYFTLVYAAVAAIIALYLARVLPDTPGFNIVTDFNACGTCRECILTRGANCEEDPVPSSRVAPPGGAPPPMTIFIVNFKELADLGTLIPQLTKHRVLGPDELDHLFYWRTLQPLCRGERITRLLYMVSRQGWYGVKGMIISLVAETEHMGHSELADTLNNFYENIPTDSAEDKTDSPMSSTETTVGTVVHTQPRPGMNVIGSRTFTVPDSKEYRFEWKGYGLILHIQDNTVTNDNPLQLKIYVCLSGHFDIPSEFELISAVYHVVCSGKPTKLTVEIQHCANIRSKKERPCLDFVGADTSSSSSLPYNFRSMKGNKSFCEGSSYGVINLTHAQLGLVAVARQKAKRGSSWPLLHSSIEVECKYRLQVFYTIVGEQEWIAHLVIMRDHEPWLQAVKQCYPDELLVAGAKQEVCFEKEAISPVIPEEGVALGSGWKIMPPSDPVILKQKVDSLTEPGHLSLMLRWAGSPEAKPPSIDYKVNLKGAKKPANFFRMQFNPASLSAHVDDIAGLFTLGMTTRSSGNSGTSKPVAGTDT